MPTHLLLALSALAALGQPTTGAVIYNAILSKIHESSGKKLVSLICLPGGCLAGAYLLWAALEGRGLAWWTPAPDAGAGAFLRAAYLYATALGGVFGIASVLLDPRREVHPARELSVRTSVKSFPRQTPFEYPAPRRLLLQALAPINQLGEVEFSVREVELPTLPHAFDGYRILQLTDFHVDRALEDSYFAGAIAEALREKPDLVVLTGDFVTKSRHIPRLAGILGPLAEAGARDGVVYLLGNHDLWTQPREIRRVLDGLGFRHVGLAPMILERGDARLAIIGTEAPYGEKVYEWEDLFPASLPDCRIALLHTPDVIRGVAAHGAVDFAVCGHTHGGQIQFPLIGAVLVPSRYGRRYAAGWKALGRTLLYVNRGLGTFFPVRVLCRAEAVTFVLRSKS